MNRYLLDVNALLAFMDPSHIHHEPFHEWLESKGEVTLVLCSHVENGVIRVAGNPAYKNWLGTSAQVRAEVKNLAVDIQAERCARDVSLCDDSLLTTPDALTPSRVSDLYLLALAVANGAKFATFDTRIPAAAVAGGAAALELIAVA